MFWLRNKKIKFYDYELFTEGLISLDLSVTSKVLMVENGRKCITCIYYIIKQLLTDVSADMECY